MPTQQDRCHQNTNSIRTPVGGGQTAPTGQADTSSSVLNCTNGQSCASDVCCGILKRLETVIKNSWKCVCFIGLVLLIFAIYIYILFLLITSTEYGLYVVIVWVALLWILLCSCKCC
jgi:hypothetical protein